jgi:glycosyltransferase involved in cell wall biosynthesis
MTSFNREKLIQESIESVLSQSYTDFELIIVDDCSSDLTWKIVKEYENKDSRIKAFRNVSNVGDYPNRNIAASYATRKYIKYLDSDDILNQGALAHMLSIMEQHPNCPLGLVGVGCHLKKFESMKLEPEDSFRQIFFKGSIIGCGPSFSILRTSEFWKFGGFSLGRHLSDVQLWLKILSNFPVCLFDESLVYWRKHEQQEFSIGEKSNFHLFNSYHIYLNALLTSDCPLGIEEREMAIRNIKNRYSRNILVSFLSGKLKLSQDLFNSTSLTYRDLIFSLYKNKYPKGILDVY